MKIKLFVNNAIDRFSSEEELEEKINNFLIDKKVLEKKFSINEHLSNFVKFSFMVIYEKGRA